MLTEIKNLTAECKRDDCSLEYLGGTVTLLGWSQTYDKHGRPTGHDPNTRTSEYRCRKCRVTWEVKSRDGHDDVVERHEPKTDKAKQEKSCPSR